MRHDSTSRADDHDGRTPGECNSSSRDSDSDASHAGDRASRGQARNGARSRSRGRHALNGDKPISYSVTAKGWRA